VLYAYLELLIAAAAALPPLLVWMAREFYVAPARRRSTPAGPELPQPSPVRATPRAQPPTRAFRTQAAHSVAQMFQQRKSCQQHPAHRANRIDSVQYGNPTPSRIFGAPHGPGGGGQRSPIKKEVFDRPVDESSVAPAPAVQKEGQRAGNGRQLIFVSAAVAGLAFLLMELVWYRMLAPLLGGTTYTFGLILAAGLLGIGLGGTAYAFWAQKR
jgi:spermidine synthase